MRSMRISRRSLAFDITTEPSSTVRRSTVKAGIAAVAALPSRGRAGTLPARFTGWRASATRSAGLDDRQLGDPRPAGDEARKRERRPHALRRKAGRRVAAAAVAQTDLAPDLAQRHGRRRPEGQLRTAFDAQPVPGAGLDLILREFRHKPRGNAEPQHEGRHRQQNCESESRDLQGLHVNSPRTDRGQTNVDRTGKSDHRRRRSRANAVRAHSVPDGRVVIPELCD